MATRAELIQAVKVKLEEISPFDEPLSFIVADGDPDYEKVKPIVSYIEDTLDKSAWKCLNDLPTTILVQDIDKVENTCDVEVDGVGHFDCSALSSSPRFIRVKGEQWKKDCTVILSSNDALSLLQDSEFTRGGFCKPSVVFVSETNELRLYSFKSESFITAGTANCTIWYIDCTKNAEDVQSDIADFIALQCAAHVYDILGRNDYSQLMLAEYDTKKQLVLQ